RRLNILPPIRTFARFVRQPAPSLRRRTTFLPAIRCRAASNYLSSPGSLSRGFLFFQVFHSLARDPRAASHDGALAAPRKGGTVPGGGWTRGGPPRWWEKNPARRRRGSSAAPASARRRRSASSSPPA